MRSIQRTILSTIVCTTGNVCLLGTAQADQVLDLGHDVSTATRIEQPVARSTIGIEVIEREEIERVGATDVAGLLERLAGVDIARNGGPGQPASLFLRGTESNHVLVLVDGVRINPGTLGGAAFNHIDPDLIERIEVIKGPRSSLYGTEAVGGVINIITRRTDGPAVRGRLRLGSDTTRETALDLSGDLGPTAAQLSISHLSTEGFPTLVGSDLDRGHENLSVAAGVSMPLADWTLEAGHWEAAGRTEYFDFFGTPVSQDFQNGTTRLQAERDAERWGSRVIMARSRDRIDQKQSADFVLTRRDSLDWQLDVAAGDHHLVTGLYLAREHTESLSFGSAFDEDTAIDAVFIEDLFRWGGTDVMAAARYTDHETAGSATTWNLEFGRDFGQRTRARLAAGTGFRAPDATDRFGVGGDPDLDPERSRSLELGIAHRLDPRWDLDVALFESRIEDLIEFDLATFTIGNTQQARIRGLETTLRYRSEDRWLRLALTLQDPENRTTGDTLARRSRQRLDLSAGQRFGKLSADFDFTAVGERPDSPFSTTINPGYGRLDVGLSYSFRHQGRDQGREHHTLRLRLENVLDHEYATAAGFRARDRALFLEYRGVMR